MTRIIGGSNWQQLHLNYRPTCKVVWIVHCLFYIFCPVCKLVLLPISDAICRSRHIQIKKNLLCLVANSLMEKRWDYLQTVLWVLWKLLLPQSLPASILRKNLNTLQKLSRSFNRIYFPIPMNLPPFLLRTGMLIVHGVSEFYYFQTLLYNDLLFFNIRTSEWRKVTAPNAPPPRCSHQVLHVYLNVRAPLSNRPRWQRTGKLISYKVSIIDSYCPRERNRSVWTENRMPKKKHILENAEERP